MDKLISRSFYVLFFFVPLIFWPTFSELFEFNKMVAVYIFTVLIVAAWLSRCLAAKKLIFRRTTLDLPILIFLGALLLSTVFSIDIRTSLLGYYSRFHGGLASYLSYSLLYWAYVSNMNAKKTLTTVYCLLISASLASIYGVLQHFGIDKNVWVQDVQNRIFSTLGQPNWLAAWIVVLTPITWGFALSEKLKAKSGKFWMWVGLSTFFFVVLLFTKSRSGLLGFLAADVLFWSLAFQHEKRRVLSSFLIHNSLFLILALAIGTPFTTKVAAPETGGTESGEIRKIVWKGSINLWRKYPILGTGPETFAYSYYEVRPLEHNFVSEWDFLYNKAHNEYLNFAATTGTVGIAAYLILIVAMIWQIMGESGIRNQVLGKDQNSKPLFLIHYSLFAGYTSILVTNFFGFSVVPVALLFFMFPAFAVATTTETTNNIEHRGLTRKQKALIFFVLCAMLYALFAIGKYWYSDLLYAKGKQYNASEIYDLARSSLLKSVSLSPGEPVFWGELAQASAGLAEKNSEFSGIAIREGEKAVSLSPRNLNLLRNLASVFIKLANLDSKYLLEAKRVTENAILYAPTDAKLYYNLALTTYRLGQAEEALALFNRTIEMKPNYKNARFAKALILVDLGQRAEARDELVYILENIEPNDNLVRQELKKLN